MGTSGRSVLGPLDCFNINSFLGHFPQRADKSKKHIENLCGINTNQWQTQLAYHLFCEFTGTIEDTKTNNISNQFQLAM